MKTGFGWIDVRGVRYDHDIIIHADHKITKRKKKLSKDQKGQYGHTPLTNAELEFLSDERPKIVFIGTGQYEDLPITPEAAKILQNYYAVIMKTPEILSLIDKEERTFAALLHVTC